MSDWICCECGLAHGRRVPSLATYHVGDPCDWCGRFDVPVTEPRDWGNPIAPTRYNWPANSLVLGATMAKEGGDE